MKYIYKLFLTSFCSIVLLFSGVLEEKLAIEKKYSVRDHTDKYKSSSSRDCEDTDNNAVASDGATCCTDNQCFDGDYNDDDCDEVSMCCACGGGSTSCINDDSIVDSGGDTCSDWYDEYSFSCGNFDTDEFIAADLCCACGGGLTDVQCSGTSCGYYLQFGNFSCEDIESSGYDCSICEAEGTCAANEGPQVGGVCYNVTYENLQGIYNCDLDCKESGSEFNYSCDSGFNCEEFSFDSGDCIYEDGLWSLCEDDDYTFYSQISGNDWACVDWTDPLSESQYSGEEYANDCDSYNAAPWNCPFNWMDYDGLDFRPSDGCCACDGGVIIECPDICDDETACNYGALGEDCQYLDCAGECGGDAVEDCDGICGGSAAVDDCGICSGGTTGLTPNANSCGFPDDCEACVCTFSEAAFIALSNGNEATDCTLVAEACADGWNSQACIVCELFDSDYIEAAQEGVCTNSCVASEDTIDCWPEKFLTCDDEAACNYGEDGNCQYLDCASVCGGAAVIDCAGVCGGSTVIDCAGLCGGSSIEDECGICDGNGVDLDQDGVCDDVDDCIGNVFDICGICNGDDSACENCYNISWYSDAYCDDNNNTPECNYDGGDCCPGDCNEPTTASSFTCEQNGGTCEDCIDPNSLDNVCGGECSEITDINQCGILGCTDETAYNYDNEATVDDSLCISYGDVNIDGMLNVADLVMLINFITYNEFSPNTEQFAISDFNSDNTLNILDVVVLVNTIVGDALTRGMPASNSVLSYGNGLFKYESDGQIAGIQLNISGEYTILKNYLPKGWGLENNDKIILLYSIDGSSLESNMLFEYVGDFSIESSIVADWYNSLVNVELILMPGQYYLSEAYPNPFNPTTTISFGLPQESHVVIDIYDIKGQKVEEIINQNMLHGTHSIVWNADSHSSGVYFIKMLAGEYISTQKLLLVK